MTNKELLDKIREEILHLKMKELQRTNGVNTGADVYLSSYAVLSILSNALTEENHEKKYNEALNDMRVIYPNLKGDAKLAVEHAFPELRESEDERIRKWLADYFSSIKGTVWIHRDITCEQILGWLEKQKENPKNAISIPSDCATNAKCPYKIHGDEDFIGDIKDTPAYHFGFDEGVRSEREKQKEQKPDWSEEDQLNLNWVIAILNGEPCDLDIQLESLISWLKSLRPQPHWKPSEEHLSALLAVFNDPNNIGSQTCQLALTDLYEQLKKL